MSTPAGWYDDGSGRLRWWDGELWTEHFAPEEADADPNGGAEAEVAARPDAELNGGDGVLALGDVEATAGGEDQPARTDLASSDQRGSDIDRSDGLAPEAESDLAPIAEPVLENDLTPVAGPVDDLSSSVAATEASRPPVEPESQDTSIAPHGIVAAPEPHGVGDSTASGVDGTAPDSARDAGRADAPAPTSPPAPGYAANGTDTPPSGQTPYTSGQTPYTSGQAPYSSGQAPYSSQNPYPGQAHYPGQNPYPSQNPYPGYSPYPGQSPTPLGQSPAAAPGIHGPGQAGPGGLSAGAYPVGYGVSSPRPAPSGPPVVGLVGLGVAVLGIIFSMVQDLWVYSWILLVGGLVVSLVSLFLRARKWPGVTGMIVSVVGFIVAAIMGAVLFLTSVVDAYDPYDSDDDYSSEEPFFDEPVVVEAGTGETVSITQTTGTTDVSIDSATWSAGNGLADAENGGYLTLHLTWESVGGETFFAPSYIEVESPSPAYMDGLTPDQLSTALVDEGRSISGILVFDVAQSDTYTVLIRDELMRPAARITVTP